MRIAAPAKVNLGLRIVGRRADGYHLLASLFAPLALADELEVEGAPGRGACLRVEGCEPGVPEGSANLVHRAALAFREAAGLSDGVRVVLRKHIPVAAGLGGGSSDAAATLRALDALFGAALGAARLRELALDLGADVPFFLDPRPALVTGIGERIEPLAALPELPLVLAHPGVPLATAAVYRAYDESGASLTLAEAGPTLRRLAASLGDEGRDGASALAALLVNDLEEVATRSCPAIASLRQALAASGARAVGMSGSGPTVYGIFEGAWQAREARETLRAAGVARSWVTRTLGAPAGPGAGPATEAGTEPGKASTARP